MRLILLPLAALLLTGGLLLRAPRPRPASEGRPIVAAPVLLDRARPGPLSVGGVRFRRGWVLSSRDWRFGGLSSMALDGRGGLIAISDQGGLFRFRLPERAGPLAGSIGWLPGAGDGTPKSAYDSEAMTRDPATGRVWIGLEYTNTLRRLSPALDRIEADVRPLAMKGWPQGTGPETLVRLRDGRFVVLSEGGDPPAGSPAGSYDALLFAGDPTAPGTPPPLRFAYRPPTNFRPTDAAELPDGRLLVLNRRFSFLEGVGAALTLVDPAAIRAGATIPSREIARFEQPLNVDNMEALAIGGTPARPILWIASDDNFSVFQRTLLLELELLP